MGVRRNFFQGGAKSTFRLGLILFRLLTMQCKWTYTKRLTLSTSQRKCPMLRQQLQTVFFLWKFYTKPGFFKGVLGTRFGSLELKIGSLESENIIKGNIWSSKHLWFVKFSQEFRLPAGPYRVPNIFLKETCTKQMFVLVSIGISTLS